MTDPAPVFLVVPCYNEARRLDVAAFTAAVDALPWVHLCFVDDGSTDGTRAVLQALQAHAPARIDVLSLARNGGKAEAVRRGLLHVMTGETSAAREGAVCGFWDADLSAPLSELPALAAVLSGRPDVRWVWAVRLRALGRDVTRGALRHYLGRGFATAVSLALDLGVYDSQCGAKLFRIEPLLRAVLAEPFLSRWVFDVELLSRADALVCATSGARASAFVYELPLGRWHHRAGSKVRAADFLTAGMELLRIRAAQPRWRRALHAAADTATGPRASAR